MSKGKADISNFAIRAFLTLVGHRYDELRGFPPFKATRTQMRELLEFFNGECCYCGTKLAQASPTKDHLIPLNKTACGLHAWGNVVPCCSTCNARKHNRPWQKYLDELHENVQARKRFKVRIEQFLRHYRYDLQMNELAPIADNLYADVGAVAMTLIDLRFKQASSAIEKDFSDERLRKAAAASATS